MKKTCVLLWLCLCCALLGGCGGGQEIESCLFVLAMAVDPAPDGNLTVTVKALSGTQEAASGTENTSSASSTEASQPASGSGGPEAAEPGYIVMSATAPSCLRALNMLSSTTPRTVNLSQLREIVISRTLAETDATISILREIHSMYRANGEAIVVVTPDDAGDFIRRQRAILGIRLSKYLEVLFDHFSQMDTIPADAQLASVIAAMESDTIDATAVYAAGNAFDSEIVLGGADMDRLPGHLPRTAPAENEYLGCALFSGARMTGTLTGEETGLLRLMMGQARRQSTFIENALYRTNLPTRVRRKIDQDGTLSVHIAMSLKHTAGEEPMSAEEIAARIERDAVAVLLRLRAASCDAVGFGRIAIRRSIDIPSWEKRNWPDEYERLGVRVTADVSVL
ncbi:MAG: Ger(x)C family spore germination C-terminal domain-containing protein [Eubacteriales bacterium]|nr:Ger(x)C family spore germination C-terminal domain-containing protein [Eubacteriales bacterium]